MPRIARIVIPRCPHHVTQRGNHRQRVSFADSEHDRYLAILRKYFTLFRIDTVGYGLMPNHVHHVLIPATPYSLAKGLGRLHNDFARWQQVQRDLTGHPWQNRFFSCPLDEDHLSKALRYIELNPVWARFVRNAWEWAWSSARAHVTAVDETGLLRMELWRIRFDSNQWKSYLQEGMQPMLDHDRIRLAARTGHSLGGGRPSPRGRQWVHRSGTGGEDFVRRLEALTGRSLLPNKRGPTPGSTARKAG
jgi:putative transposase